MQFSELRLPVLQLVLPVAPALFERAGPPCVSRGYCPEGEMGCGRAAEMQDRYAALKKGLVG